MLEIMFYVIGFIWLTGWILTSIVLVPRVFPRESSRRMLRVRDGQMKTLTTIALFFVWPFVIMNSIQS